MPKDKDDGYFSEPFGFFDKLQEYTEDEDKGPMEIQSGDNEPAGDDWPEMDPEDTPFGTGD